MYILSIDCMGGDNAPDAIIEGVYLASKEFHEIEFLLFGDLDLIKSKISKYKNLKDRCKIIHSTSVVTGEMSVKEALKPKMSESSMRMCLQYVAEGKSDGAISAGNTGAYLALAKHLLKTIDGISRPAIIGKIPTIKGQSVMLDLGGNIEYNSDNLVEFAIMGKLFAQNVLKVKNPSIGLLNVGVESIKGNHELSKAKLRLESIKDINFIGFVEGNDIYAGNADVFVTDGFSGNISLKTAEGVAKLFLTSLKNEFKKSILLSIGSIFIKKALVNMKKKLDPRLYNGALWLGLRGTAVKSHGSADGFSFYCSIKTTVDMIKTQINQQIEDDVVKLLNSSKTTPEHDKNPDNQ